MVVENDGPLTIEETVEIMGAEIKPPPERVAAFLNILRPALDIEDNNE